MQTDLYFFYQLEASLKCFKLSLIPSFLAVRFGRVPKREKMKMAEEMQRATERSQIDALAVELEDDAALISSIEWGFAELGEIIRKELTGSINLATSSTSNCILESSGGCPLSTKTANESYWKMIKAVVDFSKNVKGFNVLYQKDRVQLLKVRFFWGFMSFRVQSSKSFFYA